MIIKPLFVAALIVFSTSTFALKTSKTANAKDAIVYTENKQNIFIDASHPDFTIKLKSNPTTGFSWFLREYNPNLITPMQHSFIKPDEKLIGAPGYELWSFHVKSPAFTVPHQTLIRLVYTQPWQSNDTTATQLLFRVSTQQMP